MGVEYTLNTRGLDRLAARLGDRADAFVRALAFKIEAGAKHNAPVDTGFLRSSIAVRDRVIGDGEAEVVVSAEYGIYVERGTSRTKGRRDAKGRYLKGGARFLENAVKSVQAEVSTLLAALAVNIEGDAK